MTSHSLTTCPVCFAQFVPASVSPKLDDGRVVCSHKCREEISEEQWEKHTRETEEFFFMHPDNYSPKCDFCYMDADECDCKIEYV